VAQYAGPVRARWSSHATTPDELLLWFHRVGWDERLRSGRTLWDELAHRYQTGVDSVRAMQRAWTAVQPAIDADRFREVQGFLAIQEREARWWRDATLQYFQTFSRRPLPAGVERPAHPLEFYQRLRCPADRDRPRCDAI
jgi:alpha-glucuronidase